MITPISRRVIPAPTSRVSDDSGVIDPGWYGFFRAMWLRTGGPLGNGVALGNSPDLLALQSAVDALTAATLDLPAVRLTVTALTAATLDLPAVRLTVTALTVALADVQTLAAVQSEPDLAFVQPMQDLSELYTMALTLPDDTASALAPADDPMALAILASD